jgi:hypothetical protein
MNNTTELTTPLSVRLDRRVMRYFLFVYTWTGTTKAGNGNLWMECETFPSNCELKKIAAERCPEMATIVIMSWNEFETEQDYRAFIGV